MTAGNAGTDPLAEALRCPVHGIPDCSPLLNGCSIPNYLHAAANAARAHFAALLAGEATVEKVARVITGVPFDPDGDLMDDMARAALAAIAGLIDEEASC